MTQRSLYFGAALILIGLLVIVFMTQGLNFFKDNNAGSAPAAGSPNNGLASSTATATQPDGNGEVSAMGMVTSTYQSAKVVVIEMAQSGTTYYLAQDSKTVYQDENGHAVTLDYIRPGFIVRATGRRTKSDTMIPREVDVVTAPNILVYSPKPDSAVNSPIVITGEAREFENQFSYRIKDQTGKILKQGSVYAQSPDVGQFGPFTVRATIAPPATPDGWIELYDNSEKDGSEIDLVRVPIRFAATGSLQVDAYFQNRIKDPKMLDCGTVYPVARVIARTSSTARAAVEALLEGPTALEASQGYFTSLNPDVKLNSLSILNGTAKADFSAALDQGVAGSCRVTAIRAEIEQTLLQFSSVKNVIISVNGRTEDILQP